MRKNKKQVLTVLGMIIRPQKNGTYKILTYIFTHIIKVRLREKVSEISFPVSEKGLWVRALLNAFFMSWLGQTKSGIIEL